MSFDKSWENNIYTKNKHINRYPYGELISVFFNSLKFLQTDNKKLKLLELGCGCGNNLWFFAENGFDTFGIDGSNSACKIAKQLCEDRNINATILNATFDSLPFEDNTFDIIIDREATYCGKYTDIKQWWQEASRVLKKGGLVISFRFSEYSPDLLEIKKGILNAKMIESNTYYDIKKGTFKDTGIVHFTKYEEIFEIFNFCNIKYIKRVFGEILYCNKCENSYQSDEYIIVGVKE